MQFILILLACYAGVLYYLFNYAAVVLQEEWDIDRRWLLKKAGCILGAWVLLSALNYLLLLLNAEFLGRSEFIFINVFCGAVGFSAGLGFFADRRIFSAVISLLYLFDLFQFNRFAAAVTGDSLQDSGIGWGGMFSLFINFAVFALTLLADHFISLEEPENKFW
ncbi:hypothetical protein [Paenibacillus tianjinensis]|uniref:Uncharacterized protein n=1 Tax=Paenibacillus tianjinensis TaxID=2810347 RepID=A0ABX7L5E4_9BACL|nr:hypothetical protein [Paenibacillus tianjinensis]QSF43238.1 hypothetical protein JRJ22_18385 [Paenibacillus tianjinensis]